MYIYIYIYIYIYKYIHTLTYMGELCCLAGQLLFFSFQIF